MTTSITPPAHTDGATATPPPAGSNQFVRAVRAIPWRNSALYLVLVLMAAFFASQSSLFLTSGNLINIAQQSVVYGLLALGLTAVVLTGGIDLSFPAVVAVAGMVAGWVNVTQDMNGVLAAVAGIGAGLAVGAVNGFLVSYTHLQPFVITLGTYSICVSLALWINDGSPTQGFSEGFSSLATFRVGQVPVSVFILLAAIILFWIALRHTRFGRFVYATGGSERAANLAGIRVLRIKLAAYVLCGGMAGLAGVVQTSTLSVAQPAPSFSLLLIAIAAVVIGGASLTGGVGTVLGTVTGVLLLTALSNGLNVMAVEPFYQDFLLGIVVIGSVLANDFVSGRRA